jgi:hypothetical protein
VFGVYGLGFRVWDFLGFRIVGFRVWDFFSLGFRVQVSGFRVSGFGTNGWDSDWSDPQSPKP